MVKKSALLPALVIASFFFLTPVTHAQDFGTGWLLMYRHLCNQYSSAQATISGTVGADSLDATIDYQDCTEWDTQITIPAVNSIRIEAGHIAFATLVLVVRWGVILSVLFVVGRWFFRILTQYRSRRR